MEEVEPLREAKRFSFQRFAAYMYGSERFVGGGPWINLQPLWRHHVPYTVRIRVNADASSHYKLHSFIPP